MPSLQSILDRAEEMAIGPAGDANMSVLVDSEITAYVIFPHALRCVLRKIAVSGGSLEDVSRANTIEIVDGEAALPDAVVREALDSAYLPSVPFASLATYTDYNRYRFDNQLCYFTVKGDRLYYSCPIPAVHRTPEDDDFTTTLNSRTISSLTDVFTSADVGKRIKILNSSGVIVIDAIISSITGSITLAAKALSTVAGTASAVIYDTDDDTVHRALTSVNTTADNATVTCAGGNFTSADVGRRFRCYDGSTLIVDAIIDEVTNATTIVLRGKAISTTAVGVADVLYSALILHTPTIPELPGDIDDEIEMSPRVAEDVILTIAAVLRGEITLKELMENEYGKG